MVDVSIIWQDKKHLILRTVTPDGVGFDIFDISDWLNDDRKVSEPSGGAWFPKDGQK